LLALAARRFEKCGSISLSSSSGRTAGTLDYEDVCSSAASVGALEKIAHAKTGLSRTDDDDVFDVQATVGSVQAKLSAHNEKYAKAH
jgi:hypothetical protein